MLGRTAAALTRNVQRAGLGMAAARAMRALVTPRIILNLTSGVASGNARASDAVVQAAREPMRSSAPSAGEDIRPRRHAIQTAKRMAAVVRWRTP
jgi:hypothetical protein